MNFRSKGIAVIYLVVPPSDNMRLAFLETHFKFNKCDEKKISESSLQNSVIMKISNVMEVGFLEFSKYVTSFIRYWSMFKQKISFMEVSVKKKDICHQQKDICRIHNCIRLQFAGDA